MTHGDAVKALLDKQQTIFGFQGGLGIEFYVAENVKLNVDAKYQYNKKTKEFTDRGTIHKQEMKYNGPVFMAGIAYVF
jgi:opacity protein-like surface antigen